MTKDDGEHWCIKKGCKHGTLNGSLELGSKLLASYNSGYTQGFRDASIDLESNLTIALMHMARSADASDKVDPGDYMTGVPTIEEFANEIIDYLEEWKKDIWADIVQASSGGPDFTLKEEQTN